MSELTTYDTTIYFTGVPSRSQVIDENISAEQQYPERKNQKAPGYVLRSEQEEQRQYVAEDGNRAGSKVGIHGHSRGREILHRRHLGRIDVHQIGREPVQNKKHIRVEGPLWLRG